LSCLSVVLIEVCTRLEGLHYLRELVLDSNRIKTLAENSFIAQKVLLKLHLEENRIRELNHLSSMTELRKLFLGMNKLQVILSRINFQLNYIKYSNHPSTKVLTVRVSLNRSQICAQTWE
uniref:Uncharacterized protein n=1 Tax=Echeneis naucrates TaxID=173247 RepID=A0A665WI58_ECHNA